MASSSNIQALAEEIPGEFHPEKTIFFGSHAPGDAQLDSDVVLNNSLRE
jgi:predicted nucleotidyltransferase